MAEQSSMVEEMRQFARELYPDPKDAVFATAEKFLERGGFTPTDKEIIRVQFAHLDLSNQRKALGNDPKAEPQLAQLDHQLSSLRSYGFSLMKEPDATQSGKSGFEVVAQIKGYLTGYESIPDADLVSLLHQTHPPQGFED